MKIKKIRLIDEKLLRFLMVGVLNTAVGAALMFGLYNLAGWSYWLATAANYTLTSILSFVLNKYFTFRDRTRSWQQVLKFALHIAVCYLAAYGIAKPLCRAVLTHADPMLRDNVSMLAGMVIFTGLNYLGQRLFAFRSSNQTSDKPDSK